MINYLDNANDHEIYVDNFFSSYNLFVQLKSLGIRITGTVRANKTSGCTLKNNKSLKKESRGSLESKFEEKRELYFLKWHDNSVFIIAGNHQSFNPVGNAKRWSTSHGKEILVPQPFLISQYNKYMGGVDHLDWLI